MHGVCCEHALLRPAPTLQSSPNATCVAVVKSIALQARGGLPKDLAWQPKCQQLEIFAARRFQMPVEKKHRIPAIGTVVPNIPPELEKEPPFL